MKSGLEFDCEAVNDVLVVHGISISYKTESFRLTKFLMAWQLFTESK